MFLDLISLDEDGTLLVDYIREHYEPPASTVLLGMALSLSTLVGQSLPQMTIGFLRGVAYASSLRDATEGRAFIPFANSALISTKEVDEIMALLSKELELPLQQLIGGKSPLSVTLGYLTQFTPEVTSTLMKNLQSTRSVIIAFNQRKEREQKNKSNGQGAGKSNLIL